ncbi:hypothetical protein ACFWF7_16575 [Nocardia sp. NPDC060256]|uniref:hypothetical protein n=1 Tax=unclassified Nocardia TaxID=2637762 RepID=UPI00365EF428
MRPPIEPGTCTAIEITYFPARGNEPERWRARVIYRDIEGTVRRLEALRPDPDEAANAVEDRLDKLGIY